MSDNYDDSGIQECPSCLNTCKDDVTIEDHGVCYDCHHEILNGERCSLCYELDHTVHVCPEAEPEGYVRRFNPNTGRWYTFDNHPSLTNGERNA